MRGDGRRTGLDDAQRLRRLAMRPTAGRGADEPEGPAPRDLPGPLTDDVALDAGAVPWAQRLPRLGPWTTSAVRGLALLLAVTVALVAYWAWSGRPRAVAVAPTVLATSATTMVTTAESAESAESVRAVPASSVPPTVSAPPIPTVAATVVVHVTGQVVRPGLVELPAGSRVADAIDAAGGVTRPRAADSVNLARVLLDGEQIVVGPGAAAARAGSALTSAAAPVAAPVDLNAADVAGLDALPGIGPVLAARIVQWRLDNGPFRSVDELGEVSGIGDAILGRLRPLVRV